MACAKWNKIIQDLVICSDISINYKDNIKNELVKLCTELPEIMIIFHFMPIKRVIYFFHVKYASKG